MQNSKMHFEQVPVETVLKIATVDISVVVEVARSAEQGKNEVSDAFLDEAEAKAQKLAAHAGNGAVILDQITGRKPVIDPTRRVSGSEQVERT
jgi:hypothetical protein